jgi:hypothetical protein
MHIASIGIDIGKTTFHLVAFNAPCRECDRVRPMDSCAAHT